MSVGSRIAASTALVLCLCAAATAAQTAEVEFSSVSWNFGSINRGDAARFTLVVTNRGRSKSLVSLVPACDCLSAEPGSLLLAAGAIREFRLSYDSSDDLGEIRKDFVVSVETNGSKKSLFFAVTGKVRAESSVGSVGTAEGWGPRGSATPAPEPSTYGIILSYYYTAGCRACERFLAEEIPRLQRGLDVRIFVEKRDVLDTNVYAELQRRAESLGKRIDSLPVLVTGDVLLQGEDEIRGKLEAALEDLARRGAQPRPRDGVEPRPRDGVEPRPRDGASTGLAVIPVAIGGLLDGINPCAFTTLIFLLASLALAGRGRREVLVIGTLFSLAVFFTYLSIGLGLFAALRAASIYAVFSVLLRWLLIAVLLAFAALSVYDGVLVSRGRPTEILLQLPMAMKRRIHDSIRARVRTAALAGSSLALGFLVSVFEFACTGQVYLPTLAYLARLARGPQALALLVIYNLAFIAPLLAVFAAGYLGVGSDRVTRLFQRHMAAVKFGLAAFFLALAVFTLAG